MNLLNEVVVVNVREVIDIVNQEEELIKVHKVFQDLVALIIYHVIKKVYLVFIDFCIFRGNRIVGWLNLLDSFIIV